MNNKFGKPQKTAPEFKPTPAMKLYAFQRAKLGNKVTELVISEKIGINNSTISTWKNIPEYLEWLEWQVSVYRSPILELLEQIALDQVNDYRFWEAMAEKYGFKQVKTDHEPPAVMTNEQVTRYIDETNAHNDKRRLEELYGSSGVKRLDSDGARQSADASRLERGVSGGSNGNVEFIGKEEG